MSLNNPTESFVQLKYFTPFDINRIPKQILEAVYSSATGTAIFDYDTITSHRLTLHELLTAVCDEIELINGIRKELIKFHE